MGNLRDWTISGRVLIKVSSPTRASKGQVKAFCTQFPAASLDDACSVCNGICVLKKQWYHILSQELGFGNLDRKIPHILRISFECELLDLFNGVDARYTNS